MSDDPQTTARRPGPWTYRAFWVPDLVVLLVLAAAAVWAFTGTGLDLRITRLFYDPTAIKPFHHHLQFPWKFFYEVVSVPVMLLAVAAVFGLWRSGRVARWRRYRAHFALILAALALGPGVAVNLVFKDHWGRPRPRHVQEFGGHWTYRDAVEPGVGGKGKSFPCGHSSAGYFFTLLYFLLRRRRPALRWSALLGAVAFGTLLGAGRVIAGSHFASDVVWSGLIVTGVSWVLYYFAFNIPGREDSPPPADAPIRISRRAVTAGALVAGAILVASVLATPYYGDILHGLTLPAAPPAVRLDLAAGEVSLVPGPGNRLLVEGQVEAFGLFGSRVKRFIGWEGEGPQTSAVFRIWTRGFFTDASVPVTILVPTGRTERVRVNVEGADVAAFGPPSFASALEFSLRGGSLTLPPAWSNSPPAVGPDPAAVRYQALPEPRAPTGVANPVDDD